MFKQSIKPMNTAAPKSSPNLGSVSAVGPNGAAPAPRGIKKNTRDYGKAAPAAPMAPSPSPFGPVDGGGM